MDQLVAKYQCDIDGCQPYRACGLLQRRQLPTQPAAPSTAAAQPATAAEVATGLRNIDQIAKQVAESAGTDKAKAASLDGQIEPAWKPIEDTVKQNDQNTYLAMEDSFAVLEKAADDGDAPAAAKGSAAVSSAVQGYLAKYAG